MTFDLIRFNWPNTAAILALAAMPAIALATLAPSHTPATEAFLIADATNFQAPVGVTFALAADPTSSLE